MMTSKPEDRLRKNGVKTRKYYKWLRWSMKYEITEYLLQNHIYTVSLMGSHHQQLLNMNQDSLLFYTPENQDMDGLIEVFSAEYVINLIYAILKGRKENNMNK